MDKQLLEYIAGELCIDELKELFQRIENEESLKTEFVRLHNLNAVSKLLPLPTDRNEGIKNFKLFTSQIARRTQRVRVINILKYASIVATLIISTVWGTLFLHDRGTDSMMNTLYVPAGQRAQITLQDGTKVWLNAQSTFTYPARFSSKQRNVSLMGEAYFDVAENKNQPFVVTTQQLTMEVLGTEFNVYSYPESGYTRTSLVEGALKVSETGKNGRPVLLSADQQVTYCENGIQLEKLTNSEHLLWRDGIYAFNNERLIDIIAKLELYYDINIRVEDPEIFNMRYTGKFRQRDGIDEILYILQKIQSFKINENKEKNMIILSR